MLLHTMGAIILAMVFFVSTQALAHADVLFEHRISDTPHPGVEYERVIRMTGNGILDIHVLTVPLNDSYLYIGPVTSQREHGLRETTTNLLSDAGAVAGINADFFGMASLYSVHFGPMAMDGQLIGLNAYTNYSRNEFAAFFLDSNNNPFFDYMQADIRFYNNGVRNVDIASFNVIGAGLDFPVIVDRQLMPNTLPLMERFSNLTKIVVQNNSITQITRGMVVVPSNGYVVVLPYNMYGSHRHLFNVGESAHLHVGNNLGIDFSRIQMAIGGGGTILAAGQTVYGSGVAPNARHPRSAVGTTRDGNYMILMVADGRNHSIGATNSDMAALLREFGAWDAMHFDGGGSSTMAVRQPDGRYSVVNTPSDGAQRRVINALGVFDSRTFEPTEIYVHVPALAQLNANPASIALFGAGQQVNLRFSGVATDGNTVPYIPVSRITEFVVEPPELGTIYNGVFTAGYGSGYILAYVEDIFTSISVTIGGSPRAADILGVERSFVGYPATYVTGGVSFESTNIRLDYDFIESNVTQAAHLAFYPGIALPAGTIALNLEMRGNGSGHWLRARVRDGAGRHHNIDFANSVDFDGWQSLTATMPAGAQGPFVLDRIYAVALRSAEASQHSLLFGRLETIVAPPAPVNVPQGQVFRDWLWADRSFTGIPAGNNFSFALPYLGYDVEYYATYQGPFAVTTMTLYGRRLGPEQWGQFLADIRSTNPSHVVILMDDDPLRGFRHSVEFDLFHEALGRLRDEGRNVFVVSATGVATAVSVRDGIRYINLARDSEYIHFRTHGSDIWWAD